MMPLATLHAWMILAMVTQIKNKGSTPDRAEAWVACVSLSQPFPRIENGKPVGYKL